MSTTKVVPGNLIAREKKDDVSTEAAKRVGRALVDGIRDRGGATIALSGGNTPKDTYALLAKNEDIDWTKIQIFFVDERAVGPDSDRSNFRMARESLIEPAKIPDSNVFRMKGEEKDLAKEAARYEEALRKNVRLKKDGLPNLDVVILGVGDDGHTASMFPGEKTVDITDKLVASVAKKDAREARITMTTPILEHARAVFILAVGDTKHAPLERVWKVAGDVHETPARIVRNFKGTVTWIIDRAAAGLES